MALKPVYYPAADRGTNLERPGEYPFTRGIYPNMYRGRLWTMRQYAGFGTAEESSSRLRYLLEQGQTGLSIAFDLPTQMGMDPDHPLASGEVGKVGVSIASLEDMEILLREIPLERVSISMTINSTAAILLCMVLCIARRRGVSWESLRGTIQNDILKEYIARGTYIFPPVPSLRLTTDVLAFCRKSVPNWNAISISGYHIREAGSTAVQEVAFTLADGIAYVQSALDAGMEVDEFAGQLSFFFNAHNDLLEEIAKFRAARRLWARIMRERFGAKDPRSWSLRFHAQTAGSTLTARQPGNNVVRVTIQALAAVLGGAQSLHTNSLDEALALPSELAVRTALRTQQIIAFESGVANTADPVGGSYAIEELTDQIEADAMEYIRKIDARGGMLRAIETGYIQREIQESAYRHQQGVEAAEIAIVGVNKFTGETSSPVELHSVAEGVGEDRRRALAELRANRDEQEVQASLQQLGRAAGGQENLLPYILEATDSLATVGEISNCLRDVFGEYRESIVI
ncbi:MAG TPA: methylmalonyl-CoA mutase family protein [Acidobacteriota bacterium]|nr:methylmalonyl-CoA mutase family protein [Acidobacteriota bacterium]